MAFQRAATPEGTAEPLSRRTTYSYKRSACHRGRQHHLAELARMRSIAEGDGWLLPCSRTREAAEPWPHSRQSYSSSISKNQNANAKHNVLVTATWKATGESHLRLEQFNREEEECVWVLSLGPSPLRL